MNYSKGIISIPNVTGNLVITVTTEGQAINLFDPTNSLYNYRLKGDGTATGSIGKVVTNFIDISDLSSFVIGGVTPVYDSGYGYAMVLGVYTTNDGSAASKLILDTLSDPTALTFDCASWKKTYPTARYARVCVVLNTTNVSVTTADTANMTIYGS